MRRPLLRPPSVCVALVCATSAVLYGCPKGNDTTAGSTGAASSAPSVPPSSTGAASAPSASGAPGTAVSAPASAAPLPIAFGALAGRVTFAGKTEPAKPIDTPNDPACEKAKVSDPRVTRIGKANGLFDVIVRLAPGSAKGDPALAGKTVIKQDGCAYVPHVSGAVVSSDVELVNLDRTMHNIHGFQHGTDTTVLNFGHAAHAPPVTKPMPNEPMIVRLKCDVHPWMTAYVVVSDHPYFASTAEEGKFAILKAPVGTFDIEAWHPLHGSKRAKVTIAEGQTAQVDFAFKDSDKP